MILLADVMGFIVTVGTPIDSTAGHVMAIDVATVTAQRGAVVGIMAMKVTIVSANGSAALRGMRAG